MNIFELLIKGKQGLLPASTYELKIEENDLSFELLTEQFTIIKYIRDLIANSWHIKTNIEKIF